MKIAFTAKGPAGDAPVDPRFGRTDYILIYDEDSKTYTAIDNREVESVAHGAGPQTAKKLFELEPDVLITGNGPGGNAATALAKAELKIFTGAGDMSVEEAYKAFRDGKLTAL